MAETIPVAPPAPHGPVPSERQWQWHQKPFYGFVHFGVNTFTGKQWGYGDESPAVFNPPGLDVRQWARVAHEAGLRGLILTAKHHDGFCLWPSPYTEHSVKHAPWSAGRGDVVKELAGACREFDLELGLYLSPWDRNHAEYGRPAYVESYRNQLEELLTNYGEVFTVWFDGANGGTGFYGGAREERRIDRRTYYDFPSLWEMVRRLQSGAVMFSDAGPDVRWVGNESGMAPDPHWARIDPEGIHVGEAPIERLAHGDPDGSVWRPAEADTSIRPSWFYDPAERPKPLAQLLDIYYHSVGKGCGLNLNLPPDQRGLLPEEDVARLMELRRVLDETFKRDIARGKPVMASNVRGESRRYAAGHVTDGEPDTYWAADDAIREATLEVDLGESVRFNVLQIEEFVRLGQRVEAFAVDARVDGDWFEVATGSTIGVRRLLRFPEVRADAVRLRITRSLACPVIGAIGVYRGPGKEER